MMRHSLLILTTCAWLHAGPAADAGGRIILKPKFDPDAERVELFQGIEQGRLSVRVTPRDSRSGALFIENLSDRPLTVEMPEAVVGVHVLPQGSPIFDQSLTGPQGNGNQNQNQPIGTGFSQGNNGNSGQNNGFGNNGFNQNFFSVPPERVARIPYVSVCLAYGRGEPRLGNKYQLVPAGQFSKDETLHELLAAIGTGNLDHGAVQAAAWHVANGMSWEEIGRLKYNSLGVPDRPMFTALSLWEAQEIVAAAKAQAVLARETRTAREAQQIVAAGAQ